jgi:hypothetical protein
MNFNIRIDHNNKVIIYKHFGEIKKEDIGAAWYEFLQMEEFTQKKYNLLSDYSEGKFILDVKEVDEITEHLYKLKDILENKKQAIIINEPVSAAISVLFEGEVNEKVGFKVTIFSTIEAGMKWLKM